jgi:hypothetical protein
MKKQILSVFLVMMACVANAQYDFTLTGRNDVPVLGMQWGLTGGGFTSMLTNRDDIEADARLDINPSNFTYAGGIEGIYWFQRTVGFGGQVLYWKGGAAYTGYDSLSQISMTAKTDLTYLKIPLLFHFKSYNRYYPDRRFRFSAMFGPYVSVLNQYSDDITLKNKDNQVVSSSSISDLNYVAGSNGEIKGKLNSGVYNPIDLGFVFGLGGEIRIFRRTVLALHVRSDIGFSNVERTKGTKITYDSDLMKEVDFNPWKNLYSKYNAPTAADVAKGWEPNRPASKNLSAGVFLSIRKYIAN